MTWNIRQGDVLDRLRAMPDESVQCCVTSPPYWGLRDYGVDGQIGLEASPEEHVRKLVEVFREVRRVLRDDGVLWLNYGDAYTGANNTNVGGNENFGGRPARDVQKTGSVKSAWKGLKPKDLIGLPWMLAFALRADGWWLRSDCIWHKPNPMPESVTDRPTRAHEYVFLLSKSARYFYDAEAIREPDSGQDHPRRVLDGQPSLAPPGQYPNRGIRTTHGRNGGGRNTRTVWTINPQPTPEAHFATFPEALAERCIKAGTSAKGACAKCGAPWDRVTDVSYDTQGRTTNGPRSIECRDERPGRAVRAVKIVETTGWRPTCDCGIHEVRPCVVLDPFAGSGTTLLVAERLGRDSLGIELNPEYIAIAERRIKAHDPTATIELAPGVKQASLFSDAAP